MNRLLEYITYVVVTLLAKEQYGLNQVDQNNNFTVMNIVWHTILRGNKMDTNSN